MSSRTAAASALSALALSACSVVGIRSGTEQAPYTVLQTDGPLQIRQYGPRLAAETEVTGTEIGTRSAGFRRLARYIFGANGTDSSIAMTAPVSQAGGTADGARTGGASGATIAMTAPVAQDRDPDGHWRIAFFMPAGSTEATLPQPDDPAVRIVAIPARTYAVYRYTGSIGPAATATATQELLRRLRSTAWTQVAAPVAWFYDPPWTIPFLRRNEAAVQVERAAAPRGDAAGR